VVRLSLRPKEDSFFELLRDAADTAVEAVRTFDTFVDRVDLRETLVGKLRDYEHAGDEATKSIINKLNTSFITPFDHEDIYRLAVSLDDVLDLIDSASDHVVLYGLGDLPGGIKRQVAALVKASELTAEAMPRLRHITQLSDYWTAIKSLESEADREHRRLLAKLFSGEYEALEVMKLKEVVDDLEDAVNAYERVAKTVEAIAVKES
jgi:predicted phosphate transport protein (TIGR00153 family)